MDTGSGEGSWEGGFHRRRHNEENTRTWEGDTGHDRRRQKATNTDTWEGDTGVYRSRYKEHEKTQKGRRSLLKYRRIIGNKTANRTMNRHNVNANNTREEPQRKIDGKDATISQDQNPNENMKDIK